MTDRGAGYAEDLAASVRRGMRTAAQILLDNSQEVGGYSGWGGDVSSATADERAKREGRIIVLPKPNELFVDIDNDLAFLTFWKNYNKLQNFYAIVGEPKITNSPSGEGHHHIVVTLEKPVEPTERIILQAFLGSDLTREFLGLQRIILNDPRPTLFLETDIDKPF